MQMFPSQVLFPTFWTFPGMLEVSSSSRWRKVPCWSRNPTMILGTPNRNDWAQNFKSFRSYFIISRSFLISAEVFSSTQLIGSSFRSGLQSQTRNHYQQELVALSQKWNIGINLICFDLPASTSPPMTSRTPPIPVRTTEQYCALLLTISSSRPSISWRGVWSQLCGSTDKVSNL